MGWIGWTERQTLETTIPAIELAYDGLVEKLRATGAIGPAPEKPQETVPTEAILSAFRVAAAQGHK